MRFVSRNEQNPYPVSSDRAFESAKNLYRSEKTTLEVTVVCTIDADFYRREEIDFDGYRGERAKAYLYLPRELLRPTRPFSSFPVRRCSWVCPSLM